MSLQQAQRAALAAAAQLTAAVAAALGIELPHPLETQRATADACAKVDDRKEQPRQRFSLEPRDKKAASLSLSETPQIEN